MYKNLAATRLAACFSVSAFPQSPAPVPLKIGFVYVAPVTNAVWVRQHDQARRAVQAANARPDQGRYFADIAAGKTLSDAQILNMNFLVQGIQGALNP